MPNPYMKRKMRTCKVLYRFHTSEEVTCKECGWPEDECDFNCNDCENTGLVDVYCCCDGRKSCRICGGQERDYCHCLHGDELKESSEPDYEELEYRRYG